MKLLAGGLLLAAWAYAQPFEIRGVAMEPGTNHAVDDAEIIIRKMGPRVVGTPVVTREVGKLRTDAQGRFVFRPDDVGEYILTIQKEGFGALLETGFGIHSTQINLVLTKERPSREVLFSLARPGEVIGRIVDYDTGVPLTNTRVLTYFLGYVAGRRFAWRRWDTLTDSDGRFRAVGLAPGRYIAEITPWVRKKSQTEFSPDDVAAVDQDYEHAYFPGGPELDTALPVQVAAGATVDIGTYRARKTSFYRALVSVSGANCASGAEVNVQVFLPNSLGGPDGASGVVPCGKQLLIPNLAAGNYRLTARTAVPTSTRVQTDIPLTITNKNVELSVTLARSPDLTGQMVRAEGARKIEWEKLQLQMFVRNASYPDETAPIQVDAEGRFRFENRLPGIREVHIVNLPSGTFVKQMRYRGIPLSANMFNFTGEGQLEIEIDDQAAVMSGSVRNGDKPVEGADVVLLRWPMEPLDNFASITHGTADDDGKFQFSALPAGEYRVLALSPENRGKLEEPGVLQRVLPGAEKVTLNRGGSQTVTLIPVDPSR